MKFDVGGVLLKFIGIFQISFGEKGARITLRWILRNWIMGMVDRTV
jgi:hypothetical protein